MATDAATVVAPAGITVLMVRAAEAAANADAASVRFDREKARLVEVHGGMANFEAGRSPELADAANAWRYWTSVATRLNTELTWRLLWRQMTGGSDA